MKHKLIKWTSDASLSEVNRTVNRREKYLLAPTEINAFAAQNANAVCKGLGTSITRNFICFSSSCRHSATTALRSDLSEARLVPRFDHRACFRVYNYGAIGSIVGHELTHNYDNIGRRNHARLQEDSCFKVHSLTKSGTRSSGGM